MKLRIAKLIQFFFLGSSAEDVVQEERGDEQMLRRSVNGDGSSSSSVQACSPPRNQSKHEQSQEEEEEEEEEEGGRKWAYPDDFCEGRQDLTFTSTYLTKRSRQAAKDVKQQATTSLVGDNLRIYLNDDPEVVARYREEYLRGEEERLERWFCKGAADAEEEVSLKSLGSSVLESKVYKVWRHSQPQKLIIIAFFDLQYGHHPSPNLPPRRSNHWGVQGHGDESWRGWVEARLTRSRRRERGIIIAHSSSLMVSDFSDESSCRFRQERF